MSDIQGAANAAAGTSGLALQGALQRIADQSGTSVKAALAPSLPRQRVPKPNVLTAFAPGHGWTTGGSGITWNLNDTAGVKLGPQVVSGVTAGTGLASWVQSAAFTAVDMTNMDITLWVQVTANIDALHSIEVSLGTDSSFANIYNGRIYEGANTGAPVRPMREGEIYPLRFNFEKLTTIVGTPSKASIVRARFTFKDKNTGAQVAFRVHRVDYHPRPAVFPTGVVSIGFDDSDVTHYTRAFPTLSRYGLTGTLYLMKEASEGQGLTVPNLQEMQRYGWEGAGHATTLDRHQTGVAALAAAGTLEAECQEIKTWLADIGANGSDHFAYPRGWHSVEAEAVIARYYATARTVYENPMETVQPAVPLRTRALTMGASVTTADVLARADRAIANGGWLQLIFHQIVASGATGNQYNVADLDTICAGLAARNIPVLPTGDVFRAVA